MICDQCIDSVQAPSMTWFQDNQWGLNIENNKITVKKSLLCYSADFRKFSATYLLYKSNSESKRGETPKLTVLSKKSLCLMGTQFLDSNHYYSKESQPNSLIG